MQFQIPICYAQGEAPSVRAARPRVHGGMGGVALRRRRVGGEAALLVLVDDCAAVRGIVALVHRGGMATRRRGRHSLCVAVAA